MFSVVSGVVLLEGLLFMVIDPNIRQTVPMLSSNKVGDETPSVRHSRGIFNFSMFKLLSTPKKKKEDQS